MLSWVKQENSFITSGQEMSELCSSYGFQVMKIISKLTN